MWRWYRLKQVLQEEDGIGVVEIILILVVLIGLVIVFKKQINTLLTITADQSGRDDFREDHQRKFGNIGG